MSSLPPAPPRTITTPEESSITDATPFPLPLTTSRTPEDQCARQQQYMHDLLNKTVADGKLDLAPSHKELLNTTKLEESSITNASSSSSSLPHSPSRKELLETTKLEESSITNASSSSSSSSVPQSPSRKELLDTTKLRESSITNASPFSLLQPTSHGAREANASKELLVTTTLEESWITNASCYSLPWSPSCEVPDLLALKLHNSLLSSSFVCSLVSTGLFIKYFARMDKKGLFHTYPDRGGPFQTLEEAQEAINTHHAVQRKNMCMEGLTDEEKAVRNALYWYHDGTRKNSAEAFASFTTRRPTRELVKALLDTHNEDNALLGDDAYELIDIVRHKECSDGKGCIYRSYSHFNLTMKTKGADANSDLYFAEVTRMRGDYEAYVLTCICVVKPDDNGKCHVCEVSMKDMKHPTDDVYNHGRRPKLRVRSHRSGVNGVDLIEKLFAVHDEAWLNAEEARVRRMIKEGKEARSKLEVDNRRDEKIKKIKESRCKLEVGNKGDDLEKRDKYVVPARRK